MPHVTTNYIRALVFDCGTSETKALLYTYDRSKDCPVTMKEIRLDDEDKKKKRPGVIDHIVASPPTWETGVIEKFSNLYLKATSMASDPDSKKHQKGLDFCIVGASAWARKHYKSTKLNDEKNQLMYRLRESGLFPKIFVQRDESFFELLATIFAFSLGKATGMIAKEHAFGGVLGSGGGSCQFTYFKKDDFTSLNIEIGNREGRDCFMNTAKKDLTDAEAPLIALAAWTKDQEKKIRLNKNKLKPLKGFFLCISAQYYAAIELCAKLPEYKTKKKTKFSNKDDQCETILAGDVVEAAERYLKQQTDAWRSMTDDDRKKLAVSTEKRKTLKDWALGIANVSICSTFWREYFDPTATLCFKRDWIIGKERANFRNTWSAGWFIDIIKTQKGIDMTSDYPQMSRVLRLLDHQRQMMAKRTKDFVMTHSKVQYYVNDMTSSHICSIPEYAEKHERIAREKGVQMDQWILEIEKRLQAMPNSKETRKVGFEYRIKTSNSVERKLDSVIAGLLLANAPGGDGSYAPLETDIMSGIRDCLRYTFVIDFANYYRGVRLLEKYLTDRQCRVSAKNFWQNPKNKKDRQTMYMGLNCRVWLPRDPTCEGVFPNAEYPVEIQVHTPESYDLKNGESHEMYEDIRTENVIARRDKLIVEAFALWEDMPVPNDDAFEPTSFADYRGVDGKSFTSERKRYSTKKKEKKKESIRGSPTRLLPQDEEERSAL